MKNYYLALGLLLFLSPLSSVKAQISYRSHPVQAPSYVEPIDTRLLSNTLARKQQQFDRNVQSIQGLLDDTRETVNDLKGVNDNAYTTLNRVLNSEIDKLNASKVDFSDPSLVRGIMNHFSSIRTLARQSFRYELPSKITLPGY